MPRYRTQVAHNLGQREAVERLQALTQKAHSSSDLKGSWDDNAFTFSVTVQGVRLEGTLQVEDDVLKFDGKLPLIALPFSGWIDRLLKKSLEQNLPVKGEEKKSVRPEDDEASELPVADNAVPTVLFLHIPKAGGQTLGEYVFNQCRSGEPRADDQLIEGVAYLTYGFLKEPDSSVPAHAQSLLRRKDLRAVVGHFSFGIHEYITRPWTYITVLRNPVDRVASLYYYTKFSETMSFEEFALSPPFKEVDNDQTRRIAGVDPDIGACTNATLRAAQENLRRDFSVVGTTERLDETLMLLKRKLGWDKDVLSFPKNVNAARPPTASLSPEVVNAVRKRNELDFELWQYATQLLDEAIVAEGSGFQDALESYKTLQAAHAGN